MPFCVFVVAALLLLPAIAARADSVTWTDGRTWSGRIELGEGAQLRLHDGRRITGWNLDEIASIRFAVATQRMERAWQFKEAGKTAKEFSGDPYPTMELDATVTLRDGAIRCGHLLTTVLYLTASNRTQKLQLLYKLRGRERETFERVVYPREVVLSVGVAGEAPVSAPRVHVQGVGSHAELVAVSRQKMTEAEAKASGGGDFRVRLDGSDAIFAVRDGGRIAVGWRGDAAPAVRARLDQGLCDLKDFFDRRQLIAASQDPADETICHTLLLLFRDAHTTLSARESLPWRLEVWKWRLGEETNDISAAARCVLFRGIRSAQEPLPEITLSPEMGKAGTLTDGLTIAR